jgi:hypothetical protein
MLEASWEGNEKRLRKQNVFRFDFSMIIGSKKTKYGGK